MSSERVIRDERGMCECANCKSADASASVKDVQNEEEQPIVCNCLRIYVYVCAYACARVCVCAPTCVGNLNDARIKHLCDFLMFARTFI